MCILIFLRNRVTVLRIVNGIIFTKLRISRDYGKLKCINIYKMHMMCRST